MEGKKDKIFSRHLPIGIRAALIDMDGVLYDSMPHHARAWYKMFSEQGIKTDPDEFYLYEGMTGGATIDLIIRRELGRPSEEEEQKALYARKAQLFVDSGEKKPMSGASEMLNAFKENHIKTVLVTGSAQSSLLDSLQSDYPDFFPQERRVTALDVKKGKPDPEPYLKGLEKSGYTAEEVIVVENAPLGVRAGKRAGLFTVAVTTGPIPKDEFEKEGADLIFSSMEEFAAWLKESLPRDPGREIDRTIDEIGPSSINFVTDSNVKEKVFPLLSASDKIKNSVITVIEPGEENKNLNSVIKIWEDLEKGGATRKSLLVNIGGGMISDIGGFAAATYKRGIRYINFPTTLLGSVDAATGGKTGINFQGLKNEIGAFHKPEKVIISSLPLRTLKHEEFISGYAEMVKSGLIADRELYNNLLDMTLVESDNELLEKLIRKCVTIKEEVVALDPKEKGLRKILNFGHTAGHAFESLSFERKKPVAHGIAVAHGMLVELILSHLEKGFESSDLTRYGNSFLKAYYPNLSISCEDTERLLQLMAHDKKNSEEGRPNFTLLLEIGNPEIDCLPELKTIREALDIYRDMME